MKWLLGICVFIFFFSCQSLAWAQKIVIGVSTGYPPFYYKEKEEFTGFCVEMINNVAKTIDLKIEYREYPWKRLLHIAAEGGVDAIMPLYQTEERESFLTFDDMALVYDTNYFFATKSFQGAYNGRLDNLVPYQVGVVFGYSYGEEFDTFHFPSTITALNETHLIEMFKHKRYDVGVGSRPVILYFANKIGVADEITFLDPPISMEKLFLGFTKKGKKHALAEQFAEAVQKYVRSEEYAKLVNKYGVVGLQ